MTRRTLLALLLCLPVTAVGQWTQQSPAPTGLGITGIAFTSATDGFIATGSSRWDGPQRRSLLETRDGGASWTHRLVPESDDDPLNGLFFLDSQHGWAYGNRSYRTSDGGVTWEELPFLGTTNGMRFHTPAFGHAFGNFGFATSLDGGMSWTMNPAGPRTFSFRDEQVGLGLSAMQIFRTEDGGQTFTPVHSEGGPAAAFLSDQQAVAIAGGQFVVSGDAGLTWSPAASAQSRNELVVVSSEVVLAWRRTATTPNPDGRLLRSGDGGQSWTDLGVIFQRGTGALAVLDEQTVVAVDEGGDVFRSADAGLTWSHVFDAPFTGFGSKKLSFGDSLHGWLAYGYGAMFATSDGGLTWRQVSNGYGQDLEALAILSPHRLVAVGLDGTILLTDDGGITWRLIDDGIESAHDLVAVHAVTEDIVVAVTQLGLVVRSGDAGRTWEPIGVRPDPGFEFRAYAVHFRSWDEGWVVGTRYNFPAVYHTLDGGQTWTARPYPGLWVGIDFHDDRGWILDNRGPLLRTTDGGLTWAESSLPGNHLPELELTDIKFFDEHTGYVSGWVGYLAKTTDGGQTWTLLNTGTLEHTFMSIHLMSADEIWLVTANDRVYRSVNGGQTWSMMTLQSAPLALGSFTGIAADASGNAWVVGFKGHIYSRFSDPVSSEPGVGAPAVGLSLSAAYPNPARGSVSVMLELDVEQHVVVEVFDALGRRVVLVHDGALPAGRAHPITFDVGAMPSGVYLVRARGEATSVAVGITVMR